MAIKTERATSHHDSIFALLLDDSWLFRDAGSTHLAHMPSGWPARRSGID